MDGGATGGNYAPRRDRFNPSARSSRTRPTDGGPRPRDGSARTGYRSLPGPQPERGRCVSWVRTCLFGPFSPSMLPHRHPIDSAARDRAQQTRGLGSLAASLLTVTLAFAFWPLSSATLDAPNREITPRETVPIELIEPTVQEEPPAGTPPPPPPEVLLPPVEVPDEQIVEERVEELALNLPSDDAAPDAPPAPPGPPGPPSPPAETGPPPLVERPTRSPRPVRLSEPAYPPEARREGVRARVAVRVLVDERGRPLEPRIVERVLITGRNDDEERVSSLPYGIDAAALDAAQRYQFRPAEHEGRRVRAYYTITFRLGTRG